MDNILSEREIFVVGCYPNDDMKTELLLKQVDLLKSHSSLPVLVLSHYPIPACVQNISDFVIYDSNNDLSNDNCFHVIYRYYLPELCIFSKTTINRYHAAAILSSWKNALQFCKGKYDIIHCIESDYFLNIRKYLDTSRSHFKSNKKFVGFYSEDNRIEGGVMSFRVDWMDKKIPKYYTWDDYKELDRTMSVIENYSAPLLFEPWLYRYFKDFDMLKDSVFLEDRNEYTYAMNMLCNGSSERMYISETSDGKNIIFICRDVERRSLDKKRVKIIDKSDSSILVDGFLDQGYVIWRIIEPKDTVLEFYVNDKFIKSFTIGENRDYDETIFLFSGCDPKCISHKDKWVKEGLDFI